MVTLGEFIPFVLDPDFTLEELRGMVSSVMTATMTRVESFLASVSCMNSIEVSTPIASGMAATMTMVDLGPDGDPYLEIEPTYVWVLDGWTSNNVRSNTTWDID